MLAMDHQRALKILDLPLSYSLAEAKTAYIKKVKIWHPDRFGHNELLKKSAGETIKDINLAYEQVTRAFRSSAGTKPFAGPARSASSTYQKRPDSGYVKTAHLFKSAYKTILSVIRRLNRLNLHKKQKDGEARSPDVQMGAASGRSHLRRGVRRQKGFKQVFDEVRNEHRGLPRRKVSGVTHRYRRMGPVVKKGSDESKVGAVGRPASRKKVDRVERIRAIGKDE
jgi:hypothetical protein